METPATYPNWWLLLLRGVLSLMFGVLAILHPLAALTALVVLFGIWALVDGVSAIALVISGWRSWQLALVGIVGIGAALLTFFRPGLTAIGLYGAVAVWAIARGLLEIALAIKLRRQVEGELWLVLGGISSLLFGGLMIALPMVGMLALAWLIGFYALLFGGIMIALALRLRRVGHAPRDTTARIAPPHAV